MTSNTKLDFGDGPIHDADTVVLKRIFTMIEQGQFNKFDR